MRDHYIPHFFLGGSMKTLLLLVCLTFISTFAQETTVLFPDRIKAAAFGSPVFKFGPIGPSNTQAFIVGGEGGWILNDHFIVGAGLYGLATKIDPEDPILPKEEIIHFNYGGFNLGYILQPHNLFYFKAECLIGFGRIAYRDKDYNLGYGDTDTNYLIEPRISAGINLIKGTRFNIGVAFRHVVGTEYFVTTNEQLGGPLLSFSFEVGSF